MAIVSEGINFSQAFLDIKNTLYDSKEGIFFLTGPAGSGKSTLIDYLRTKIFQFPVVTAPTGVAALNVRGQTIHSLFQLPLGPLLPGDTRLDQRYFQKSKYEVFKNCDILIIDEISMVRADTLDAIDYILRRILRRQKPFGGKKVLLVGDVFQLEPIVKQEESALLGSNYESPYFFNSKVLEQNGFETFYLKQVYRQTDSKFLGLLNTVKLGEADEYTIEQLNFRVGKSAAEEKSINLCARKIDADTVNKAKMDELPTPHRTYSGRISGDFNLSILPTEPLLELKPKARVMFLRNDPEKRYVNGTLGTISKLYNDKIEIKTDDGELVELEPETWENIKYSYNEKDACITEDTIGTYEQFAVKPAWAITIHKSQGLSFDFVHVNLGAGSFASGMLYVALSRCRTLEGLSLQNPLRGSDFRVNPVLTNFNSSN